MSKRDPLVGTTLLGRYRIVERMAKGGMGIVYLARSEGAAGFVKPVVVKRIIPELDEQVSVGMFVREARILGNLQHPGIAGIVEFAEEDGAYVMVLEYVHGYDLAKWRGYVKRTRKRFDVELALHVMIEVLDALHYAHTLKRPDGTSLSIVHRDISPSNILVASDGHVKLLDFGVARMSGEVGVYKTEDATVKGKLPYLSPELLAGASPSAANDVYSAAVVLHELLLGRNVFRSKQPGQVVARVMNLSPPPLASQREDIPPELDALLERALSKDPQRRFQSAGELAEALRGIRVLTTEEAKGELADTVRADYAEIPAVFDMPALSDRENAWRNPPDPDLDSEPGVGEVPGPTPSQPPTVASSPRTRTAPLHTEIEGSPLAPERGSARWIGIALAALGVSGVAVALVATGVLGGSSGETEQVFVVQQQPTSGGTQQVEVPPDVTPDEEPLEVSQADPVEEPATEGAPRERPPARPGGGARVPPRGEALTATFARQGGRIEGCFRTHAASVEGRPELSVRFELSQSGAVRRAQIVPATLGGTALGQCVGRVARSVRFAPQDREGVSFRIPLTVERR